MPPPPIMLIVVTSKKTISRPGNCRSKIAFTRASFSFDEPSLRAEGYTQHRGKADELRFSSVDFSGSLTVADAVRLATLVTQ